MLHNHSANSNSDARPYDPKLHQTFVHTLANGKPWVILSVYVNDLLVTGMPADVEAVKKQLQNRFHVKDFRPISTILSINIVYNTATGTLDILQEQKILDLATEFQLLSTKPLGCPLPAGTDLHVVKSMLSVHADLKFCRLVGALLYIALATRPDVLHAVVYLSSFVCAFDNTHFEAAQHVLQYLHRTIKQTIHYNRNNNANIPIIHCNASYGTNPLTMKSYSSNIAMWAGRLITWWAQLQKTVALSTAEAELVAMTNTTQQALYLRQLLPTLGLSLNQPVQIFNNNQSTITIIHKPVFTWPKRLKHVAIKHMFMYNHIQWKDISVNYIPTNNNLADFLTKHVAGPKLKHNKIKLDLQARG
jgi:hypothetical protein